MSKSRDRGSAFDAILGQGLAAPDSQEALQTIPLEQIRPSPSQPRRHFDQQALEELASSISVHGVLAPVTVRPVEGGYELVAGERRHRAAAMADLSEIPAVIRDLSEEEARALALVENLQRQDLGVVEETEAILALVELALGQDRRSTISTLYQLEKEARRSPRGDRPGSEAVHGREDDRAHSTMGHQHPDLDGLREVVEGVFDKVGAMSWRSFVKNRLPVLNLPEELLEAVREGRLSYVSARLIARLPEEKDRELLLWRTVEEGLSNEQLRELVEGWGLDEREAERARVASQLSQRVSKASRQLKGGNLPDSDTDRRRIQQLVEELEGLLSNT